MTDEEIEAKHKSDVVRDIMRTTWSIDLLLPDGVTWYTAWNVLSADAVGEVCRMLCKHGTSGPARFQVRRLD